ncbi:LppM family (lipo)protein [Glycomyces buryatensis]|uniref:LppM domain-containing protein n=1 Tax=Glycomyces buryatensis TaxID=2570927 RepID=A0A4S8QKJ8_9ACTN|nr:hypothetical protein [Glycomyces buryatensis]THV43525.1 hypothetical protein FAB82_00215 [Glycomyces buryatensis]
MLGLALRRTRRLLAAGAAVGLLFATTGCLRLDLGLEVAPDDTVNGSFTAAWSEDFLESASTGENPLSRAELDAFLNALLDGVPDAERVPYDDHGFVGQTAEFSGRPLTEFAEFGGDEWGYLRITHEDRRYLLDGHWDLRTAGFLDTESFEGAEILLSVNFPARVAEHNGELDGRTVTWTMTPGEQYDLSAEAVQYNGWAWFAASVASLVVVLALLWLWQWTRLRRHSLH